MKKNTLLNYFGYGTNRDLEMMSAIIGRKKIDGKVGKLLGYELCIQKAKEIPDKILDTAPFPKSPRQIVTETFDNNFELYIIRPKEKGVTHGTIWKITNEEYEFVRNWELLDFGMQEDIKAIAIDSQGKLLNVMTHGSLSKKMPSSRVISGADYTDYIVPKKDILKSASDDYKSQIKRNNMKTILVDAINTFVIKGEGVFDKMFKMLEEYPNKKIVLTGANDEEIIKYGLNNLPYEFFTLKHDPDKTDPTYYKTMLNNFELETKDVIYFEHNEDAIKSAESVGIKTFHYDKDKKDLEALKFFIDENL